MYCTLCPYITSYLPRHLICISSCFLLLLLLLLLVFSF